MGILTTKLNDILHQTQNLTSQKLAVHVCPVKKDYSNAQSLEPAIFFLCAEENGGGGREKYVWVLLPGFHVHVVCVECHFVR